jgi:SAM-dependent methyltransferase
MRYAGQELELFAHAKNWKRYWSLKIQPFLQGDILEVGAGLGSNRPYLKARTVRSWTYLEPDPDLAQRLETCLESNPDALVRKLVLGTIRSFEPGPHFDCLLYIDVLEHIKEDRAELEYASHLLRPGGTLIVLAPAYQWLYTPFDKSIGHFRRYTRRSLAACTPSSCRLERLTYLDSCGIFPSLGNRLLLHQATPSLKQIQVWDHYIVPASVFFDRLLRFRCGRSILGIWTKLQTQGTKTSAATQHHFESASRVL